MAFFLFVNLLYKKETWFYFETICYFIDLFLFIIGIITSLFILLMIDYCYKCCFPTYFWSASCCGGLLPACWACPGSSDSLATIRIPMQVYNFDTILLYRIIRNTIQKNIYNFNNMCISPLLTWCYAFLGLPGFEICGCCY